MHLSEPRDGLPPVLDSASLISQGARQLAAGHGRIAVDTERASAFRFDERAFLIQLRRAGAGTLLIDPTFGGSARTGGALTELVEFTAPRLSDKKSSALRELRDVMNSAEWILHAAHTDLPALTSLGWTPTRLHDTQIAGRILGLRYLGLGAMVEEFLGITIDKDKGRDDWSARPLTRDLLNYAALDVELLHELLDELIPLLHEERRYEWYLQDCAADAAKAEPLVFPEWTDLKGVQSLRFPRSIAIAQALAETRIELAWQWDKPMERVLRSKDIVNASLHPHKAEREVSRLRAPSHVISAARAAVRRANGLSDGQLPDAFTRVRAPMPDYRSWEEDYPLAFDALEILAETVDDVAEELDVPRDVLSVMRHMRPAAWHVSLVDQRAVSASDDPVGLYEDALNSALISNGARPWQAELISNRALTPLINALG